MKKSTRRRDLIKEAFKRGYKKALMEALWDNTEEYEDTKPHTLAQKAKNVITGGKHLIGRGADALVGDYGRFKENGIYDAAKYQPKIFPIKDWFWKLGHGIKKGGEEYTASWNLAEVLVLRPDWNEEIYYNPDKVKESEDFKNIITNLQKYPKGKKYEELANRLVDVVYEITVEMKKILVKTQTKDIIGVVIMNQIFDLLYSYNNFFKEVEKAVPVDASGIFEKKEKLARLFRRVLACTGEPSHYLVKFGDVFSWTVRDLIRYRLNGPWYRFNIRWVDLALRYFVYPGDPERGLLERKHKGKANQ